MIALYYHPGNASLAPHMVLRELGLPFELRLVDRDAGEHKQPAYLALNPNGLIPVLVDGSLVLYESAAICLHLADTHPEAGLMPPLGTAERAHAYKWLVWLTNTLQPTLFRYFYPERLIAEEAVATRLKLDAEHRAVELFAQVDRELEKHGGEWFLGERYTVVDPFLFMLCRWSRNFSSKPARAFPRIAPYLERVWARPAVRKTFTAEGIVPPWY
jgi:glutathione S-transferase